MQPVIRICVEKVFWILYKSGITILSKFDENNLKHRVI